MSDSEQSKAERDEALAQASINAIAQYATSISTAVPRDKFLARRILRENIRALAAALATVDGNQNTSEFLEIYSIKYSKTPPDNPPAPERGAEIIQFSERYRKTRKANP